MKYLVMTSLLFFLGWMWWYLFIRKERPVKSAFPEEWKTILKQKVSFYKKLSPPERLRFEQAILQFFHDVTITGVDIAIDDTDRLLVAASGVIPIFGFPGWRYHNLHEVLLYEGTFNHDYETKGKERNILGMVGSGAMNRMMILSKPALYQGFENQWSKSNVGIHEFVHLLDKADGATDGIPEVLMESQFAIPWLKWMQHEMEAIKSDRSDINPYGATNEAEFLSVVSEYFFNQPVLFEKKHPELFSLLEEVYRQDMDE